MTTIDSDDVDGFEFETGREFDQNGWTNDWDKSTVLPGDWVAADIDGQDVEGVFIVVQVTEDGIMAVEDIGTEEGLSNTVDFLLWDQLNWMKDRSDVIRDRPEMHDARYTPDSLKQVKDPSEDDEDE